MSRGVKDLREMVCLSRQSVANETGEHLTSDEESDESVVRNSSTPTPLRPSGDGLKPVVSPDLLCGSRQTVDGGYSAKKRSPGTTAAELESANKIVSENHSHYGNPRPLSDQFNQSRMKARPSPGVGIESWGTVSLEPGSENPRGAFKRSGSNATDDIQRNSKAQTETLNVALFTEILKHINKGVILNWLELVKRSIDDMSDWCLSKENFVHFAHSWLSLFSEQARNELTELEFSILRDNILSTIQSKRPPVSLFDSLLSLILHEFSSGILVGQQGAFFFLDYMDGLTSSATRRTVILTDVRCSQSSVKSQYYESILALRSFALVSIWSAILDRYRSTEDYLHTGRDSSVSRPSTARSSKLDVVQPKSSRPKTAHQPASESQTIDHSTVSKERTYQAIRYELISVL
jgi:FAM220 family